MNCSIDVVVNSILLCNFPKAVVEVSTDFIATKVPIIIKTLALQLNADESTYICV